MLYICQWVNNDILINFKMVDIPLYLYSKCYLKLKHLLEPFLF